MKKIKYILMLLIFGVILFAADSPHCLVFEDENDYVYIDDSPLKFETHFTLECWFNIEEFTDSAALIDFSSDNLNAGHYFGYGIYTMVGNRIAIRMGNSNKTFEMQIEEIKENIWYHLAVTYDKYKNDENVVVFLNGQVVNKSDCNINIEYPETFKPYGVMLGAFYDYPFLKAIKGRLDDVRFWSVVRTNKEIRNNINSSLAGDERGLVGYYTFDQDADTLLMDSSPSENHGKLENMTDSSWQLSYAHLTTMQPHDISFNRLVLPWISSPSFSSYCVDVSRDTNFNSSLSGFPVYDVETDYYILDDIEAGTYYFRVKGHYDSESIETEPWSDIQVTSTMTDASTPIELSEFKVSANNGSVLIEWTADSQTENAKYVLEKRCDPDDWKCIHIVPGEGTTSKSMSYSFEDKNVITGRLYEYRLKDIAFNGDIGLSDIQEIMIDETSENDEQDFRLISLYPNPFNPRLCISFELYRDASVDASIFSLSGERVHHIHYAKLSAGTHSFEWYPKEQASGMYVLNLGVNSKSISHKLLYIK